METSRAKQTAATLIVLIAVTLLVVGVVLLNKDKNGTKQGVAKNSHLIEENDSHKAEEDTTDNQQYKDGTYRVTGGYVSPGGNEKIAVSVTLKDDIVIDTSAESKAVSDDGARFQQQFIRGYKKLVVGKKLNEAHLSRVSGSSLTSGGFNDALEQIEQQAKV